MEQDSGKGMTKVCSVCKHIILSEGNFFGIASFKMQCANEACPTFTSKEKQRVTVGLKYFAIITTLLIVCIISLVSFSISNARKITCASFSTHEEAQALFLSNKKKYNSLDRNNNGIACESLIKKQHVTNQ